VLVLRLRLRLLRLLAVLVLRLLPELAVEGACLAPSSTLAGVSTM
jgi:hypothetical protein